LDGTSGSSLMPRKMLGIAISVIEASSVASSTPSVQLERAIHLYLSDAPSAGLPPLAPATAGFPGRAAEGWA
jgi:hypothetical protein